MASFSEPERKPRPELERQLQETNQTDRLKRTNRIDPHGVRLSWRVSCVSQLGWDGVGYTPKWFATILETILVGIGMFTGGSGF